MPKFLPKFADILQNSKDIFAKKLQQDVGRVLEGRYREELDKAWQLAPPRDDVRPFKICAVDGSRQVRELANGVRFYVTRALGITNFGAEYQSLNANILQSRGIRAEHFSNFISYKMEFAELQVIKQFLDAAPAKDLEDRWICFLDGAWFGRIQHQIMEFLLDDEQDLLVKYHLLLQEVFTTAKAKEIWLVGVSKDSNISVFRDLLLQKIGLELLRTSPLAKPDRDLVAPAFAHCDPLRPNEIVPLQRAIALLGAKAGAAFLPLKEALLERMFHHLPDAALVMKFTPPAGYSTPAEVGPSGQLLQKYFSKLIRSVAPSLAKQTFRNFLSGYSGDRKAFLADATRAYIGIRECPAIYTLTMQLNPLDLPIRVDFPAWMAGNDRSVGDYTGTRLLNSPPELAFARELVQSYLTFYGGPANYHVFLTTVDEEVKFSWSDMDEIYERLIEQELGTTLIHTRDKRRIVEI